MSGEERLRQAIRKHKAAQTTQTTTLGEILTQLQAITAAVQSLNAFVLARISGTIDQSYDNSEFEELVFNLGYNADNLAGATKSEKIRSLLIISLRNGRIDELIAAIHRGRPQSHI